MIGFAFVPYTVALQCARLQFIPQLPGAERRLCIYYLHMQENLVEKKIDQPHQAGRVKMP